MEKRRCSKNDYCLMEEEEGDTDDDEENGGTDTDTDDDDDLLVAPPNFPKIPTIQEHVNEVWKRFMGMPPVFDRDRLLWMNELYKNLLKFNDLQIDYDVNIFKKIKKNIMKFMFMKTPMITEQDRQEISERSMLSSDFRKGFLIILATLDTMIRFKEPQEVVDQRVRNLKKDFFLLDDYLPSSYSLYEIRLAISIYRSQLIHCTYSKPLKIYFKLLEKRINEVITWCEDPSTSRSRRLFDYELFFERKQKNDDNNNNITTTTTTNDTQTFSLTDYFFNFVEKFIYYNKRKFYLCKKENYSKLGCEISPSIITRFLKLLKEKLASSAVKESLDTVFARTFPSKLVLTSDFEHFMENNKDSKYVSSFKILSTYRIQDIQPYGEFIRQHKGFCDAYLKVVDHYFEYVQKKTTVHPFFEEFSCVVFLRLMEEKISVDLEPFIVREENIYIPITENNFYRKQLPFIVKTFRGWNLWDFIQKKFINYKSFIECGIAFIFVLKDLTTTFNVSEEETYESDYDTLRKASRTCRKFFERELQIR